MRLKRLLKALNVDAGQMADSENSLPALAARASFLASQMMDCIAGSILPPNAMCNSDMFSSLLQLKASSRSVRTF